MSQLKPIIAFALFFASCTYNSTYINRTKDVEIGNNLLTKFYKAVEEKDSSAILNIIGDTLVHGNSKEAFIKMLWSVHQKLGKFEKVKIERVFTKVVVGNASVREYHFKLLNTYEFGTASEIVGFLSMKDEEAKLAEYRIEIK